MPLNFYWEQRKFLNSRNLFRLNLFNKIIEPPFIWTNHLFTWNKTFKLQKYHKLWVLNDHDDLNVSIIFTFYGCLEADFYLLCKIKREDKTVQLLVLSQKSEFIIGALHLSVSLMRQWESLVWILSKSVPPDTWWMVINDILNSI